MASRMPRDPSNRDKFPVTFYVDSFIQIVHCISDDLVQCDATTQIGELYCEEFDDVDFELALCCFEATHKLTFKNEVWTQPVEDFEDETIEEFIERFLDLREQTDPLFVTKRFLMFQDELTRALTEDGSNPPPAIEP